MTWLFSKWEYPSSFEFASKNGPLIWSVEILASIGNSDSLLAHLDKRCSQKHVMYNKARLRLTPSIRVLQNWTPLQKSYKPNSWINFILLGCNLCRGKSLKVFGRLTPDAWYSDYPKTVYFPTFHSGTLPTTATLKPLLLTRLKRHDSTN